MIVADCSVVVSALLEPGRRGDAARDALRDAEVAAPDLLDVEVVHAVRGLLRGAKVAVSTAERCIRELPSLGITRVPHQTLTRRMWELRDNLTAYDAVYVALAESLGCSLITCDAGIAGAPGLRCAVQLLT